MASRICLSRNLWYACSLEVLKSPSKHRDMILPRGGFSS